MGLVSKTAKVKWNSRYKKYYMDLGYVFTKMGDEIDVKIEDLPKNSHYRVEYTCDNEGCDKILSSSYYNYNRHVKEGGKFYCQECAIKLYGTQKMTDCRLKKSKSFYNWCEEHNHKKLLERWDYELNDCSPKDICYSSNKKYWFKCDKHPEHKSELKKIANFVNGQKRSMECRQCNSFAQYILDNFPNKKVEDFWDYDKNELNPWDIPKQKNKKVWIKCQEKDYHGSYETFCSSFVSGVRCPYCASRKVHPKDSLGQYIIDNYGEEFLHNIWSDKNNKTPFEYSFRSHSKVFWKCIDNKHEDYSRTCHAAVMREFRCPECVKNMKESVIEEKTRTYLESLGYDVFTEHKCTIRPINPKTGHYLPYDNEIVLHNGKHLIIEVHGEQHYNYKFYKTFNMTTDEEDLNNMLIKRQEYDSFKKEYCLKMGYEYLELPYTSFNVKCEYTYKQMIDDKIKEILEKEEIA